LRHEKRHDMGTSQKVHFLRQELFTGQSFNAVVKTKFDTTPNFCGYVQIIPVQIVLLLSNLRFGLSMVIIAILVFW
jgi:hypothetical protein